MINLESQPIQRQSQDYEVHDAATGLLERGRVKVQDMLARQPWPTDGPNYPVYDVETFAPLDGLAVASASPDTPLPGAVS